MMRSIFIGTAVLLAITSASLARANTEKLDNIAACTGVVLGNGAVDFYLGDEASFDAAGEFAYSAYLSELLSGSYAESDVEIADQIMGGNMDKIINAYNSETFDNEVYEEVVGCYRQLGMQILEKIDIIMLNADKYKVLMNNSVKTLKRMLRAG